MVNLLWLLVAYLCARFFLSAGNSIHTKWIESSVEAHTCTCMSSLHVFYGSKRVANRWQLLLFFISITFFRLRTTFFSYSLSLFGRINSVEFFPHLSLWILFIPAFLRGFRTRIKMWMKCCDLWHRAGAILANLDFDRHSNCSNSHALDIHFVSVAVHGIFQFQIAMMFVRNEAKRTKSIPVVQYRSKCIKRWSNCHI